VTKLVSEACRSACRVTWLYLDLMNRGYAIPEDRDEGLREDKKAAVIKRTVRFEMSES
jgi:hypothetical protein